MKIKEVYPHYFQKSYTFLYPILGLKTSAPVKPEQTFLRLGDVYAETDHRLVCVYKNEPGPGDAWTAAQWAKFQASVLLPHRMLENCTPTADGRHMVYIFDLGAYAPDVDAFLIGRYSDLSPVFKRAISDYYQVHTPEWALIESFLYPEKYLGQYAELLDVDLEWFSHGQTCSRYDAARESFLVELPAQFVEQMPIL